jgi:Domain of unknown function (DUF4417)
LPVNNPHHQPASRNLRRERRRWDDAENHSLALGCVGCVDRETCGGQHKRQNHYSCLDDCCGKPDTCDIVCPRNLACFIERVREVDGFQLDNVRRGAPRPAGVSASYVPMLYHHNRRAGALDVPVVAVPLHKLYSRKDGSPRYADRAALAAAFGFRADAQVIAIGSGRDRPIETWWGLSANRAPLAQSLAGLGVTLATSPNYSLFTDTPRHDDMYNIKRIVTAWAEIMASGPPCALHLNARTERDYERLAAFISERDEVNEVAFEFKTGGAWRKRRPYHNTQLAKLAQSVSRPLHMIMIGGFRSLPLMVPAYAKVTYIDTTAFMGAVHRQCLTEESGVLSKKTELTGAGEPIDDLLAANVEFMRRRVDHIINASRAKAA